MKKKTLRRMGCLLAAVCMLGMECTAVGAAELPKAVATPISAVEDISQYDTDGDGLVYAVIGQAETVTEGPLANQPVASTWAVKNGEVIEDGVRLRNRPSTSTGTVLELMYRGEAVYIDYTASTSVSGGWYYLKRLKTGTWGWAAAYCIYYYF